MKYSVLAAIMMFSSLSSANCISVEEAQQIAYSEIKKLEQNNPQEDYSAWNDAVFNLSSTTTQGASYYSASSSLSNWAEVIIRVSCEGVFSYKYNITED